ncbi:cupin domain-containing protein [Halosquirtibacter xylanolyticus]|uniref:cupin domain-containing protein n=1 Tax=Halosquirtibacter xylanolyticus TaxID=3374599 RepID=UPI00374851C8|nr:cupin domain-containing protein [Prolixibacteraceae bacterium]
MNSPIFTEIAPGIFRKITHLNDLMVVVIDFKNPPMEKPDPFHSHPHEQITYVAKGSLKFFIENEEFLLKEGDTIAIPAGKNHTIQTLSQGVRLIDSFSPIREDFLV